MSASRNDDLDALKPGDPEGEADEPTIVERNVYVRRGPGSSPNINYDPNAPAPQDDDDGGGWSEPVPAAEPAEEARDPGLDTRRTKIEHITARDQIFDNEGSQTPNERPDASDSWTSRPQRLPTVDVDRPTQVVSGGISDTDPEDPKVAPASQGDGWLPPKDENSSSTGSVSMPLQESGDRTDSGLNAQDDSDSPRLICIEGPDQGTEFILRGRDIAIGRGPGVDVTTKDPSMSRVHCRILLTTDQVIVTDQRSANGTIVNGRKIDRATIVSGATLKLGQSQFRYVEMGDVIKPAETQEHQLQQEATPAGLGLSARHALNPQGRPSLLRNRAVWIVAASVVVATSVVAIQAYRASLAQRAVRQSAEAAEEFLTRGIEALRHKRISDACQSFKHALSLTPTDKRFAEHVKLCEQEVKADEALTRANEALHKSLLSPAWQLLETVPDASVFAPDRQALRQQVLSARTEQVAKLRRQIQTLALTPSIVEAMQADVDELSFGPKDSALSDITDELKKGKSDSKNAGGRKEGKKDPPPRKDPDETKATPSAPASKVVAAFNSGDLDGAIAMVGISPSESDTAMRNKLTKFKESYLAAKDGGGTAINLPMIRRAQSFESKISGGASTFAKELKRLEADSLFAVGTAAQADRKYPEAYRAFRDAQVAVPGYPPAQRKLVELSSQARDVFNQGYIIKDTDLEGARAKWKQVMAMVPAEDDTYKKAKKWLDQTAK